MRRTSFTTFISIAFAIVVVPAEAGEVPTSEPTQQQSTPPSDLSKARSFAEMRALAKQQLMAESLKTLGCDVPRRRPSSARPAHGRVRELARDLDFSACPPDDRKCEVAIKMGGCVMDDVPGRKRGASGF